MDNVVRVGQVELRFKRGSVSASQLESAIAEVLEDPELASHSDLPDRVTVRENGQGFDPITVATVVTLIKLSGSITEDVWHDLLWPRVRRRLDRDDAVGDRLKK